MWQSGLLAGVLSRRGEVVLGLYGFGLHVVFGKAYALVPPYFDRTLSFPRAIAIQFPLSVVGTMLLAAATISLTPPGLESLGAILWVSGVAIFLGTLVWTIRGNLTGEETATSETKSEREGLDRVANAVVPVVMGYLAVGSYETLALATELPQSPLGGSPQAVTHLLAAGAATVLVFAIGFRLLPRFVVATPPRRLPRVVLATGAVAPLLLAASFRAGVWFMVGAVLEAIAIVGFSIAYLALFHRSENRRVGFYGPLLGVGFGVLGVGLGLWFAFESALPALVLAHLRVNLLGFLGLTIVGVTYQFYPPALGQLPFAGDRMALATIAGLGVGLLVQVSGLAVGLGWISGIGQSITLGGTAGYAYILVATFRAR